MPEESVLRFIDNNIFFLLKQFLTPDVTCLVLKNHWSISWAKVILHFKIIFPTSNNIEFGVMVVGADNETC